jgi:hypothetical protein
MTGTMQAAAKPYPCLPLLQVLELLVDIVFDTS